MPSADDLIRKALQDRAATVTQSTLRHPELRQDPPTGQPPRHGSNGRPHLFFAIAATIVAILAIAGGVYGLHGGRHHAKPASRTASPLAGTGWRLTEVRSADKTWPVPKPILIGLIFGADGRFNGRDGLVVFAGSYHTSGNRITLRGVTPDLPPMSVWENAMSSILVPRSSRVHTVTSTFSQTATTLTVAGSRWTLIFRSIDAVAGYCLDAPPPRPRTGTNTSVVPGTPTAATICPVLPYRRPKNVTDIADLVHALDALPTSPIAKRCQGGLNANTLGAEYELHFHYPSGPDVLVHVFPQCTSRTTINNRRLQAAVRARTIEPLIKAALDNG